LASYYKARPSFQTLTFVEANHFFCFDKVDNYNHYPIRDFIELAYDLSFLADAAGQDVLRKIVNIFERSGFDDLQLLYFRAMKFYSNGLRKYSSSFDTISARLLNTMIAAEMLLMFSTRGEKKSKLANIMLGLAGISGPQRQVYYDAIIEAYRDRSSYVHSGEQKYSKYEFDRETDKRESDALDIFTELMSAILVKFPDWYAEILGSAAPSEYLEKWQQKVSAYIPEVKYNLIQRVIWKTIQSLKKIERLKSDI
jgi:hypothetical protein